MHAHPLLRCLAIYRQMPLRFALTALLYTAANLSLAWQQWLVGRAVNDVRHGEAVVRLADGSLDSSLAWQWLAVLVGVAAARGVLQYGGGLIGLVIGQELLTILRERLLVQVQRLDLGYHWRHGIGELVTRTTRDADKVRDALVGFWRQVFETGMVVLAAVGLLFWYDWTLGVVPLLLTLLGLSIFILQTGRLVTLDRAVGAAYDRVNQDLSEGIGGVRVIKSFALEAGRIERFSRQVDVFVEHARAALRFSAIRIPLPQVIVSLGHVWILGWGAVLVSQQRLDIGELVASLLIATTLVFRIEGIGRVMQVFADARSSAARIWDLLDAPPQIASGSRRLPTAAIGIRFRDVSVAAPGGGRKVLEHCSFDVAPGEVVALVGATGSGKSTLASLLPRLADASAGSVQIGNDRDGWVDVRELDLAELRRRVHVVPQESFLFSDTLAANLRVGASGASDDELRAALRLASADEVLAGLKDGFDTRLGDRGVTLSGGQRQRLSLARALLSGADVLVLDDATSALDALTERRVLRNLRDTRRSDGLAPTTFLVASKVSTVLQADRVLLLDRGRIVDQGPHAQLSERNAHYRELLGIDHGH